MRDVSVRAPRGNLAAGQNGAFMSVVCILAGVVMMLGAQGAQGTVYNVGPGQTYTSIGSVPLESLAPGDTVNIYYRSTPYYEKFDIGVVGTSGQPVTIHGVPDGSGNLPILDGNGATTRSQESFGSQARGLIEMQQYTTAPPSCRPAYITIENLEIRNASTPYTFKGYAGDTQSWVASSAAIWCVDGRNVTVRNCYIHDCGNGMFSYTADSGADNWTQDLLVEGCYITACGNAGSNTEHDSYCESYRITYQYNHYGPPRGSDTQAIGNALKDRSAGTVVRFNWFDGGNRAMDLIDSEDSSTLAGEPEYQKTFVYGNIIIERNDVGNSQMIHFGQDAYMYPRANGYFYNNTFVSLRTGGTIIFMADNTGFVDCRNNIIYMTAAGSTCTIANDSTGTVNMTHNWLKPGYVLAGGGGATVNDDGTSVTGTSPGFVDATGQDFHLTSGSQCINAGTSQHSDCSSYPVNQEYVKHQQHVARAVNGTIDIGAYEYGGGSPLTITTSSLPNGTVGTSYNQTLQASGGTTPYTWAMSSGSLPSGLSLVASTGAITGTPSASGTSNFTARVTDNVSATATKALSIVVTASTLTITTSSLPNGTVGTAYSQTLAATGGTTPYTWAISSGSLPAGLSLAASTGAITGTPTASGTSNFTARVTDNVSATATKALSIVVNAAALTITTSSLPGGTVGTAYNQTLTATGGTTPYTWAISSGSLPAGVSLGASTGAITGTPTASGTSNFTARVTDNVAATATKALSIVISAGGQTNVTFQDGLNGYTGTRDTWLNSDYPTTNYGNDIQDHLQYGTPDRQLHKFDLSSIPSSATVNSATIYFYAYNVTGGTPSVGCYRVLTNWDELQATYNNRLTGTAWGTPGLLSGTDYSATALGSFTVSAAGWVSYSITSTAQGWVSGSMANYGVMYKENSAGHCYTRMSEYTADTSLRPKLVVTYTTSGNPPTITTSSLPADTVGVAYNQTLQASGGTTPYTWAISSGTLPAGLSLNTSSGAITGTPTAAGTSNFTARVTDAAAQTATKALSIVINAAISITTSSLPNGAVGTAYNQTLARSGGTTPFTWAISSGSLPAGLSLAASSGAITGTPTASGTSNFTARVTDTVGATATKALSIVVTSTLTITTSSLPATTMGVAYNQTLAASGGTTPYTWAISSGSLPAGLSLVAGTGAITGTPTASGTSNFTARVTDNASATATKALSIVVNAAVTITTSSLPADTISIAYNQTLAATGGTGAKTWAVSSGTLPTGLSLNASTGAITGTPTAAGTSNFTARATDTVGATGTKALSIVINPAVTITTSSLPGGSVGTAYNQTLAATGGTGAKTWAIASGSLPAGLSLNTATGAITGTPTTSGTSNFTARATDTVAATGTKALSIVINANGPHTYYVSTTGNDTTGDGSSGNPWATIQKGADTMANGDTVIVRSGTYAGFRARYSGASGAVKTIKSEVNYGAVITSAGTQCTTPSFIEIKNNTPANGVSYLQIEGFETNGSANWGVEVQYGDHVTVKNVKAHNSTKACFNVFYSNYCTFDGCEAYSSGTGSGFWIGDSGDNNTVVRCSSHNNSTSGFFLTSEATGSGDRVISGYMVEKNVSYSNVKGYSCDGLVSSTLRNNLAYGQNKGINFIGYDSLATCNNNRVLNNTILVTAAGLDSIYIHKYTAGLPEGTNNVVLNNILYSYDTGGTLGSVCVDTAARTGFQCDYNVVMNVFSVDDHATIYNLTTWRGLGYDTHSIQATDTALFVTPGSDYHLKTGSPAINVGTTLADVLDDKDAISRPQGGAYDIGCYEYH